MYNPVLYELIVTHGKWRKNPQRRVQVPGTECLGTLTQLCRCIQPFLLHFFVFVDLVMSKEGTLNKPLITPETSAESDSGEEPSPEDAASCLSRAYFCWNLRLFSKGYA